MVHKVAPNQYAKITRVDYKKSPRYLRMSYRKRVHPDSPASPFIFDCVIKKYSENVVDHLCDLLLFRALWIDVPEREHPVLPHRAL